MVILSIRHHLPEVGRPCHLCDGTIPRGARAVRVAFGPNARIGSGARTAHYHNRCWVAAENLINATAGMVEPWSWGRRLEDFMAGSRGELCRGCRRKYLAGEVL